MDRIIKALTFKTEVYAEVENDATFTSTAWIIVVVVSLLTTPEPEAARRAFYDKLQTPTDPGMESPRGVAVAGQQSLLVNLLHPGRGAAGVGFFRAYREDLRGFAVGCAVAAGLVLGTWLLLR